MPFAGFADFDACLAHMTKPKSEGGGGYDEETARKVCGTLQAQAEGKAKESFSWIGDIKSVPGVQNLIRGEALHPLKTVHPEEWPSVRVYLEEELQKAAHTLAGKPLLLDHSMLINGEVTGAQYEDGAIEYVARVNDARILGLINDGTIKHCSVEFEWKSLEQVNGVCPRGITFTGLSLLKNFAPGDPLSTVELVEVWEGIVKQLKEAKNVRRSGHTKDILGKEQVAPAGIQSVSPTPPTAQGVIKMNKEELEKLVETKVKAVLKEQQNQEPEKDEHGCTIGKQRWDPESETCVPIPPQAQEAEWDTKYINDLPDSAFAVIAPGGEKDEQGKTVPRTLRKLPYKNMQGNIDLPHLRNALARLNQIKPASLRPAAKKKLCVAARSEKAEDLVSEFCGEEPETASEQQGEEPTLELPTPEMTEELCNQLGGTWDPETNTCELPLAETRLKLRKMKEQEESEKDEHGCLIGKEKWDPKTEKCVPITAEARIAFLKAKLRLTEQEGELTVEEIKQKIADLTAQKEQLYKQLEELAEEERAEIQKQIDLLYAEIQAYEQALAIKIAGQTAPPETPSGGTEKPATEQQGGEPKPDRQRFMDHYGLTEEQMASVLEWIGEDIYKLLPEPGTKRQQQAAEKKGLGEAIIELGAPSEPSDLVNKKEVLALIPERRIWRSWSYGPQMLVKQLKHKLEEESVG